MGRIEGKCKCGRCVWQSEMQRDGEMWYHWVLSSAYYTTMDDGELNYCPVCGCQLGADGYAYEMVQADRVAELEAELADLDAALDLAVESEAYDWYADVEREYDGDQEMIAAHAKEWKQIWLEKARQARKEATDE